MAEAALGATRTGRDDAGPSASVPTEVGGPRWGTVALGVGFVVVTTVLQLVRQTGLRSWNTIWAEDGRIYTQDALNHPLFHSLFAGYAGYVQLVPRLLVLPVRLIPPSQYARYLALVSAVTVSLLGLAVVRASEGWLRSAVLRWGLAFFFVLAPMAGEEVAVNLANLGWPLLFATFWLLASRRRGGWDTALRIAVVVLTALTTTVSVLLLPWALLIVVMRRGDAERRLADWWVAGSFTVAVAFQGVLDHFLPQLSVPDHVPLRQLPTAYLMRIVGSLAFGEKWLPDLWDHLGRKMAALAVLAVVVVAVVAVLKTPTSDRFQRLWFTAGAWVTSGVVFAGSVYQRFDQAHSFSWSAFPPVATRYYYVPVLLLLSGLVVLVDGAQRAWLIAVVVVQSALMLWVSYPVPGPRAGGPSWYSQVTAAEATCRNDPTLATVMISNSPGGNWTTTVPCADLR